MGKVVELHPRERPPSQSDRHGHVSIEQATDRLIESLGELIRILEASHQRIQVLIDTIPDADAAARLARDHANLSEALRDAKAQVASLARKEPGASRT